MQMSVRVLGLAISLLLSAAFLQASEGRVVFATSGRLEPAGRERELYFMVPGRIVAVRVKEGQAVKSGEVLAELDSSEEKASLALAEAEVLRAKAALERLENGSREEEKAIARAELDVVRQELVRLEAGARKEVRDTAQARLARAEADLASAKRLVKRLRELRKGEVKAATSEELENAEDKLKSSRAARDQIKAERDRTCGKARAEDLAMAKARVEMAGQNAALIEGKARKEDLAMARAEVAAAKARRDAAAARLGKTWLVSPVNGIVLKLHRHRGERALPADRLPVVVVGDTRKLVLRVEVDESNVRDVKFGQSIYAKAKALSGKKLKGRVTGVSWLMGRKRLFSESPTERLDTRVLEATVELETTVKLPVGFRLDVFFLSNGAKR